MSMQIRIIMVILLMNMINCSPSKEKTEMIEEPAISEEVYEGEEIYEGEEEVSEEAEGSYEGLSQEMEEGVSEGPVETSDSEYPQMEDTVSAEKRSLEILNLIAEEKKKVGIEKETLLILSYSLSDDYSHVTQKWYFDTPSQLRFYHEKGGYDGGTEEEIFASFEDGVKQVYYKHETENIYFSTDLWSNSLSKMISVSGEGSLKNGKFVDVPTENFRYRSEVPSIFNYEQYLSEYSIDAADFRYENEDKFVYYGEKLESAVLEIDSLVFVHVFGGSSASSE